MGLFGKTVPTTVENFRALCTGAQTLRGRSFNIMVHQEGANCSGVTTGLIASAERPGLGQLCCG